MQIVTKLRRQREQRRAVRHHVASLRCRPDRLPHAAEIDKGAVGLRDRRIEVERRLLMVIEPIVVVRCGVEGVGLLSCGTTGVRVAAIGGVWQQEGACGRGTNSIPEDVVWDRA